jgi:hypothetical protein
MRHSLPRTPAFIDSKPTDRIQEIALRLVVELPGWEMHVIGTATLIAPYLAITAKHALDPAVKKYGARQGFSLVLYQVLPGPLYRLWTVVRDWRSVTDITILHLAANPMASSHEPIEWKNPRLRMTPPPPGEKVLAVGYRESTIQVTENADGSHHRELNDILTTSIGEVGEIYPVRRDSSMAPFPCFEVRARFDGGMSGGLVIDENLSLCGMVCTGYELEPDAPPVSYASTLWPMLTTTISADRGNAYPRGIEYPMIDLVRDGLIHAIGLEEVEPKLFPNRALP